MYCFKEGFKDPAVARARLIDVWSQPLAAHADTAGTHSGASERWFNADDVQQGRVSSREAEQMMVHEINSEA